MSAAGQMLLPHCKPLYWSMQTLQAVAGATARCVPSAQATHCSFGRSHMKQTGTRGLFWRPPCSKCPLPGSVWESSILSSCNRQLCLPGRCSLVLCLHSDYLSSWSCHLLCAQACLLAGDGHSGSPSSGRHASILWESPLLCSHPRALCPFSKGRGSLAAEISIFFGCPFTVCDPIPTIPWSPRASSCHPHAVFLCRLFFIWVLRERRTEEVHEPQQTTSHFYFPYCRVLYRACKVLIKLRSLRNVSAFCISTTTFLHVMGNTKLECTFATC